MTLEPRQERILLAVIGEYIRTAEPVGSRTIQQRYELDCSPATIRYEMSRLEEMGYLAQPHHSAGRIPLDKAYRHYVDMVTAHEIAPPPEAPRIKRQFQKLRLELENLVEQTTRMLSDLTSYTALVLGPLLRRNYFRFLRLMPLGDERVLVIVMTNMGATINKVVSLPGEYNQDELDRFALILNQRLGGVCLGAIDRRMISDLTQGRQVPSALVEPLRDLAAEAEPTGEARLVYGGASRLLALPEFHDLERLRAIMAALEDERVIAGLLQRTLTTWVIQVSIGLECRHQAMSDCSVITATYHIEGEPMGSLGILGPKRMDYTKVIPMVDYMARSFSDKLEELSV